MPQLPFTTYLGLVLIFLGLEAILVNVERRISLCGFLCLFPGVVLLLVRICSVQTMVVILLTGFSNFAILGTDQVNLRQELPRNVITSGFIRRLLGGLIFALLIYRIEPSVYKWLQIPNSILYASLMMLTIGIIVTTINLDKFMMIIGIMTCLLGFEMINILIQESILVFAIMTGINMLMALVGAFILADRTTPAEDEADV